jgi:hypothetical protein
VIRRLDAVRQTWWLCTLLATTVLAGCASFALLMLFMLSDAWARFSQGWLAGLFGLWLAVTLALVVLVFRRLARSQRSLEAMARRVESELPELQSNLINVVQLSEDTQNADQAFCQAAVEDAVGRVGHCRFEEAARRQTRWRRFYFCMQTPRDLAESLLVSGLLVALALLFQTLIPNWGSAASRLMQPWSFVPTVGRVQIVKVVPGDAEVLRHASLEISAEIKNPEGTAYEGTLLVTEEGGEEKKVTMTADAEHIHYKATVSSVAQPLVYRLEIGDSQTAVYRVQVRDKPTIDEVEVTLQYPQYLDRPPERRVQKDADIEAPQFTIAELRVRPSAPIADGHARCEGLTIAGRVEEDGRVLVLRMALLKDADFTIHMTNSAQHVDPNPRVNHIHVIPDKPPTVELLKPGRQEKAAPGAAVPVTIRATDDYGVGRVRLEMRIKAGEGVQGSGFRVQTPDNAPAGEAAAKSPEPRTPNPEPSPPGQTVQEWTKFEASTAVVVNHALQLPAEVKPGQSVLVRALAWDKRRFVEMGQDLQPQQSATDWHTITIESPQAKADATLKEIENLRAEIWKIFQKQVAARLAAATILKKDDLAGRVAVAGQVRKQQIEIQKATADLAAAIKDEDKEDRATIKRILQQLAAGEMLQAVSQSDGLLKLTDAKGFQEPVPVLVGTQDRIITVLQKLLDAARQAQGEVLDEMKKRGGGNLPDDTKKKLEEAKKKLDEFLKAQKKVIEASESLAKKPVEDFSQEEEQLLKTLAAAQDDWAKFMKELATDLSKLPEQDFANSSMAKELVEIQTELKMAEDALLKKSADIAVPLEQLGYERAEEITTNLEKWLPDTPDREKWSQEEALTDADKEAPMAELPGELEDIIGDLMEEEDDLFDEMEDVSSSAADSLDKGAGWDAADGPISNMSAKGVTGNRLPNTSEIGGRAGEGRQGKSSGEFVGDEAVGKGGRKTPSRLTPDPIMKGQIKDHSKEPTGGATGGGKESGQGGEGLEGPTPGSPGKRDPQRLAEKQAALRNKAQGLDLRFQVTNFHRTDLKKMIEMMRRIEDDLKAGDYQSAARQRRVLAEGLGNVKQYLEGELQLRKDTSANLPTDIQKQILGGMQESSPPGWEELNRQYFERLSAGGTKQ